jgi:penicillin amidase
MTFEHPLAVFDSARRRFNVGPWPSRGYIDTFRVSDGQAGTTCSAIFDLTDWNRAVVRTAPGQSSSPSSRHYDDLAPMWAAGEYVPLAFDLQKLPEDKSETLTLLPR